MEFKKYDKIIRYGSIGTNGVLKGDVWLSAKLDGTNGSVWEDLFDMRTGSRNLDLSVPGTKDNQGFRAYIEEHSGIKKFLSVFPRLRLYGEWLVPHTIKGYLDDAWGKFYVYDVEEEGVALTPNIWMPIMEDFGIDYVPHILWPSLKDADVEEIMKRFSKHLMKEGQEGEGMVIKNFEFINQFGNDPWVKVLNPSSSLSQGPVKPSKMDNEEDAFVASCIDEASIDKTVAKVKVIVKPAEEGAWDRGKMIPVLLEITFKDLLEEKLYDYTKKRKGCVLHFAKLKGAVARRIKEIKSELF